MLGMTAGAFLAGNGSPTVASRRLPNGEHPRPTAIIQTDSYLCGIAAVAEHKCSLPRNDIPDITVIPPNSIAFFHTFPHGER